MAQQLAAFLCLGPEEFQYISPAYFSEFLKFSDNSFRFSYRNIDPQFRLSVIFILLFSGIMRININI